MERLYNLTINYTLERKRDHTVYHDSESLSSLAPKLWDLLLNSTKNSASLKESKQKLKLGHLTAVLVEYARNMLREQDSFKSFHRFCTFGFVMVLLDHLRIIFLSCTSFSDIFSRSQATCIQPSETFNVIYSCLHILTDCRDFR